MISPKAINSVILERISDTSLKSKENRLSASSVSILHLYSMIYSADSAASFLNFLRPASSALLFSI